MTATDRGGAPTTTMHLTDLIPLADARAVSAVLDLTIDTDTLHAAAGSERLLRRLAQMLQDAAGLPERAEHEDTALMRVMLRGTPEEIDAVARIVAACLVRDEIRRSIFGSQVAKLRQRFGDDAYEAALTWDGPVPAGRQADGWDAVDAWIDDQAPPIRSYLTLRRARSVTDDGAWTGSPPVEMLEFAACRVETGSTEAVAA